MGRKQHPQPAARNQRNIKVAGAVDEFRKAPQTSAPIGVLRLSRQIHRRPHKLQAHAGRPNKRRIVAPNRCRTACELSADRSVERVDDEHRPPSERGRPCVVGAVPPMRPIRLFPHRGGGSSHGCSARVPTRKHGQCPDDHRSASVFWYVLPAELQLSSGGRSFGSSCQRIMTSETLTAAAKQRP